MEYDDPFRVEYIPKSGDYWLVACDNCGIFTQVPTHEYTVSWRKRHVCNKDAKSKHDLWRPQ